MGYKTVEVPIPLYHHRVWDGRSLTPPAPDQPYETAAYREKLLNLTPPEGRNVGMVLEGREIYFYRTPHTAFTAADKAEWARLERIIEGLKVADEVLAPGHFVSSRYPASIYVIAPDIQQATYWLGAAGIPSEQVVWCGARFEKLRGITRGTTVYRVGGQFNDEQSYEFHGWVRPNFNVVEGLPSLDPHVLSGEARQVAEREWRRRIEQAIGPEE